LSWDFNWFSIGGGLYYNITSKSRAKYQPNYSFLEISFHPWRDNDFF